MKLLIWAEESVLDLLQFERVFFDCSLCSHEQNTTREKDKKKNDNNKSSNYLKQEHFKSQQLQLRSCARVHRQLCLAINYTEIKDTVIGKWLK